MTKKTIAREVAIMSAQDGSVAIYTLPQSVKTDEDLQDYVYLTLEVDNNDDWISADKIVLQDFRNKKIKRGIPGRRLGKYIG